MAGGARRSGPIPPQRLMAIGYEVDLATLDKEDPMLLLVIALADRLAKGVPLSTEVSEAKRLGQAR